MAKAAIIEANGTVRIQDVSRLEQLQAAVGGDIEMIGFGDDASAYCDEDGKSKDLPLNRLAQQLAISRKIGLMPGDYLAGTIVIVGVPDDNGDDTDVPDTVLFDLP